MGTFITDPSKAKGKKTSKDFTEQERKDVINYLETHSEDPCAFEYLMKKYNCSNTTLGIICVKNYLNRSQRRRQRHG